MKDTKTKEQFVELRAQGKSYQDIAAELRISKQTAINWAKEMQVEIANRKTLALDALYQKHLLSTASRVEAFGEQLTKVRAELNKRSFDNVPTEKLFDLMLKMMNTMNGGQYVLALKSTQGWGGLGLDDTIVSQELA